MRAWSDRADAAERVRIRLREWRDKRGHGALTELAQAVLGDDGQPRSVQWASGLFYDIDPHDLRLRDVDAVAQLLGVQPGELVSRFDRTCLELTQTEVQMVEYLRSLPQSIRHHWLAWLEYLFVPRLAELQTLGKQETQKRHAALRKKVRAKKPYPDDSPPK